MQFRLKIGEEAGQRGAQSRTGRQDRSGEASRAILGGFMIRMIEFTVNSKEGGKRLENVFFGRYAGVPSGAFFRALRKRDVKVNGRRTSDAGTVLTAGDVVTVYVDACPSAEGAAFAASAAIRVIYENEFVLFAVKPQGMLSEPDENRPGEPSLIETLREQRAKTDPDAEKYELCHRLDRNTGGILIVCRRTELTQTVKEALNARFYRKIYSARVIGDARGILPDDGSWVSFKAHLSKAAGESRVFVSDDPRRGSRPIETRLRFTGLWNGSGSGGDEGANAVIPSVQVSCVEAMLITGRTHQIRAHLAHLGYPVAGDGKYGKDALNRLLGLKFQALWASRYEYDPGWSSSAPATLVSAAEEILPKDVLISVPEFR